MLRIRMLGSIVVTSDGDAPSMIATQPRRLALLALICRAGERGITRDRILSILWPDSDEQSGRHALTQAVYGLRRDLEVDNAIIGSKTLRLDTRNIDCDLVAFEQALAERDLERAVAWYGGPFLDGFRLPAASDFDRWLEREQVSLEHRYRDALTSLARHSAWSGDLLGAIAWWRRLTARDPLNGKVNLELVRAIVEAGDRSGALAQARIFEHLLGRELNLAPDAEFVELVGRIRDGARGSPARGGSSLSAREEEAPGWSGGTEGLLQGMEVDPETDQVREDAASTPADSSESHPPTRSVPTNQRGGAVGNPLPAPRGRSASRPSFRRLAWVGIVVLASLSALAHLSRAPAEPVLAGPAQAGGHRLMIVDFSSESGDPVLAEVLAEALRIDLSQSRVLTLIQAEQVAGALGRMGLPPDAFVSREQWREVGLREGATGAVFGRVERIGSGYQLSAEVLEVETGTVLAADRESARDSTAIIAAIDRLSFSLRESLGEPLGQLRVRSRLDQVTTASLEALQKLTLANRMMMREGNYPGAIELLEQAIHLDPEFASAYRSLAVALGNTNAGEARRVQAIRRAYELRSRLTDRERHVVAASYYRLAGETEEALKEYRAALEHARPGEVARASLLNNIGIMHSARQEFGLAEEAFRAALAKDSLADITPHMNLQRALVNAGRLEEAERAIAKMERHFPGVPMIRIARTSLSALRGDLATAESQARSLLAERGESPVWSVPTSRMLAQVLATQGRMREAEALLLSSLESAGAEAYIAVSLDLAALDLLVRRDATRAESRLEAAISRHPLESLSPAGRPYLALALYHALAGKANEARALLDEYEALELPELWRGARRGRMLVEGVMALVEGRPGTAIPFLREADSEGCTVCALPLLGDAMAAAGQPDSARVAYQRYLNSTWVDRAAPWPSGGWEARGDGFWRLYVLQRLAALHLTAGDAPAARRLQREIETLWADADPDVRGLRAADLTAAAAARSVASSGASPGGK